METGIFGLCIIIISWFIQLIYSFKNKKEIQKNFLLVYSLGSALMIIDAYINDWKGTAFLNLIITVLSLLVLTINSAEEKIKSEERKRKK